MWESNASTFVTGVDQSFWFIFTVSAISLGGIALFILFCIVRFSRERNPKATQIHGSWLLEFIWTAIPTALVLVMFYMGCQAYLPMTRIPADAMDIKVNAGKWYWKFTYPDGLEQNNDQGLTVPVGKPIKLTLISDDVVHAFYVPAFRVKLDVMPKPDGAKVNETWFEATEVGEYDLFCAEYCGLKHAQMLAKIHVVSQEDYDKWLVDSKKKAAEEMLKSPGAVIYKSKCIACHTVDGVNGVGPSFKGLFGKKETIVTDGKESVVTVDEAYLEKSIKEPSADIVKGYQPLMPPMGLTDEETKQVIDYIKGLK